MEFGPRPLSYTEMVTFRDQVLKVGRGMRGLFMDVIEQTDDEVLSYLYERQDAKMKEAAEKSKQKKKGK